MTEASHAIGALLALESVSTILSRRRAHVPRSGGEIIRRAERPPRLATETYLSSSPRYRTASKASPIRLYLEPEPDAPLLPSFADFQLPPLPSTSAGISTSPQLTLPEGHVDPFAALHPPMAPVDYSFGQPLELVAENAPQGGLSSLFEMQLGGSAYNGGTQQPFMDPLFGFNAISPGRVDGQDSGLELATDDGMFWSAFLSPPNPIAAPEMDGEASTSPNAPTPRRGRIMVAATGVATRHGSPAAQDGGESSAGPSKAWPVWNPAEKDSGITVETVADHQPGLAGESSPSAFLSVDSEADPPAAYSYRHTRARQHAQN